MKKNISKKLIKGKVSVTVSDERYGEPLWSFCQNGYQSTGVNISKTQFEMIRQLVTDKDVVEFYENPELLESDNE